MAPLSGSSLCMSLHGYQALAPSPWQATLIHGFSVHIFFPDPATIPWRSYSLPWFSMKVHCNGNGPGFDFIHGRSISKLQPIYIAFRKTEPVMFVPVCNTIKFHWFLQVYLHQFCAVVKKGHGVLSLQSSYC